jgi:hypothetical protein
VSAPLTKRPRALPVAGAVKSPPRADEFSSRNRTSVAPPQAKESVAHAAVQSTQAVPGEIIVRPVRNPAVVGEAGQETKLIRSLSPHEFFVLRMSSYGYTDKRIEEELRKKLEWQEGDTIPNIRNRMYEKLGVSQIEKERDRFSAAGKLFFRVIDSEAAHERDLIEPDYTAIPLPTPRPVVRGSSPSIMGSVQSTEASDTDRAELERLWCSMKAPDAFDEEDVNELMRG